MHVVHPVAVYMDTLRFLGYFDDVQMGRGSLWSTWNQGEHHGLLPQAFVYVNARLFNLNVYGATVFSGVVIGFTGLFVCFEFVRTYKEEQLCDGRSQLLSLIIFAFVTFAALFSLSNWELYLVDVGAALFAKNLVFIVYWIALDRALRSVVGNLAFRIIVIAAVPLIVLLVAFGWSYAFVFSSIVCIFWIKPSTPHKSILRAVLLASLVASICLYVAGGYLMPAGRMTAPSPGFIAVVRNITEGFLLAISSIFVGQESMSVFKIGLAAQMVAACLAIALTVLVLFQSFVRRRAGSIVPIALIFYALLDACAVAVARGRFDPTLAMAPRYFEDLSLLVVGLTWLILLLFRQPFASPVRTGTDTQMFRMLALVLGCGFVIGQGLTAKDELRKAPYRHQYFLGVRAITLQGARTPEDAKLLQQPLESAIRGTQIQAKYGLGPFRGVPCSTGSGLSGDGWHDDEIGRIWMQGKAMALVKNCGTGVHVRAVIPNNFPGRTVTISVDGLGSKTFNVEPGRLEDFSLPGKPKTQFVRVNIAVDKTTRPSRDLLGNSDSRDLGLMVLDVWSGGGNR